jgi:hypothetical protein
MYSIEAVSKIGKCFTNLRDASAIKDFSLRGMKKSGSADISLPSPSKRALNM